MSLDLPDWVAPMMAQPGELPADDDGWAYEMKWDGVRASAYLSGGALLRLVSRTGREITTTYPELQGLGPASNGHDLIVDGEIVAFDHGRPSFEALQPRIHVSSAAQAAAMAAQIPATCIVFDLLYLDGQLTTKQPYQQRRELLDGLALNGPSWQTPPAFTEVSGADILAAATSQRMEGVVAKRLTSRYRPGERSPDWVKVKPTFRQEAVVGGVNPGQGNREGTVGSLLIGVQTAGGLAYAGKVGTGFNRATLHLLDRRLAPLHTKTCPFATEVPREFSRNAQWVRPRMVIEVAFAGWTQEGRMRAASYRGLRTDKDPADVVRET
jgi:bifunctional non-homologous end joining protein LigD